MENYISVYSVRKDQTDYYVSIMKYKKEERDVLYDDEHRMPGTLYQLIREILCSNYSGADMIRFHLHSPDIEYNEWLISKYGILSKTRLSDILWNDKYRDLLFGNFTR